MNDAAEDARVVAREAAALVPALTERLKRHGLGEIEVRRGELRVRVVADEKANAVGPATSGVDVTVTPEGLGVTGTSLASEPMDPITSPAVGYFVYADGLGPGLSVAAGTEIGFVEMLGIRHEVRATADGVVRHLVAESGEPVEYGQLLVELERAGAD
jgi:acetyl-CoA carboxylase biotin carboxyl carrier protein